MCVRFYLSVLLLSLLIRLPIQADTVTLTNGDALNGKVIEQNAQHVVLDHDVLGRITIPREKLMSMTGVTIPPPIDPVEAQEAAEEGEDATTEDEDAEAVAGATELLTGKGYTVEPPKEEEPPNPGLKIGPVSLFDGWDRRFELGITGAEGVSENMNVRAALGGFYEDPQTRWLVDMVYYRATDSGNITDNNFYAQATRDWLLPDKKYFYFATGRYDWDQFQDWDHRLSGAGGVGYQFIKQDNFDLLGRLGAGGNQRWGGDNDGFTPEALIGINVFWKINQGQSLLFNNSFYPDLSDINEFRNLSRLEWLIKMDAGRNLALKLGMTNEYQSDPGGDVDKNDFKYYLSLVWDF